MRPLRYLNGRTLSPVPAEARHFDIPTHRITPMFDLENPPARGNPGLAVSPDKRTILYMQSDAINTDIILLENFR
jgi:hypothetical protein